MKVAIFSIRSPIALDMANKLSTHHEVIVIDTYQPLMFKLSKVSKKVEFRKCPYLKEESFTVFFDNLIKEVDFVIPTCEEGYHEIFQNSKCINPEGIGILHSKIDFLKVVSNIFSNRKPECGTKNDVSVVARDIQTPYGIIHIPYTSVYCQEKHSDYVIENSVIKKKFSRFGEDVYIKPRKKKFTNEKDNPWLVQDYQTGQEVFVGGYANKGKLVAYTIGKPFLRHENSASFGLRREENILIEYFITTFVKETNYTGFIGFDLLVKDRWIGLIECNPRATSAIHMMENLQQIMFEDATPEFTQHIVLKPVVLLHPIKYIKNIKTIHQSYCPISNSGAGAVVGAVIDSIGYMFQSMISRTNITAITTKSIKRNKY